MLLAERNEALRRIEGERARFYELLNDAPAAVTFHRGPQHVIEFVNRLALQLSGNRESLGRPVREAYAEIPDLDHFVSLLDDVLRTGNPYVGREVKVLFDRRGSGTLDEGYFDFVYQPTRNREGQVDGILSHSIEVTDQVKAREQIAQHNELLERMVDERTEQLREVNQELESFSYTVSHDLRAPVRHIGGFVELLERRASDSLDEKSRHYVSTIGQAAKQMGLLIDALLEFSRLGRNELKLTVVDINALAHEVRRSLQSDLGAREVQWVIEPLPHVRGDATMLRSVFANLLGNALKYTSTREHAHIEVGAKLLEHGREVELYVKDNGVGFQMQYAHKLFGVFQRLHANDLFEGTGIGLATVRRVITRHGGRVWAEGAPDQGATFYCTLPAAERS